MPTLSQFKNDVLHNPIANAEVKHIKGQQTGWRRKMLYAITILVIFVPIFIADSPDFSDRLDATVVVLMLLNFVVLIAVEWRAVNLIYHSIAREIMGHTWESLILTHVDTWKIVLGKWAGVVRGILPDFLFLGSLRIATLFWIIMNIGMHQTYKGYNHANLAHLSNIPIDISQWLIGSIVVSLFIVIEMLLITAFALPFALSEDRSKGAMIVPFTMRIWVPGFWALLVYFLITKLSQERFWENVFTPEQIQLASGFIFSLSDNGVLFASAWIRLDGGIADSILWVLPGMILGTILMMLTIIASLWFSTLVAHRQNVSKPGFIPKPKPKRR